MVIRDELGYYMDLACDRCGRRLIADWVKNNPVAARVSFPKVTSQGVYCEYFWGKVMQPILEGIGNGWRINPTKDAITCPDCPMILKKVRADGAERK